MFKVPRGEVSAPTPPQDAPTNWGSLRRGRPTRHTVTPSGAQASCFQSRRFPAPLTMIQHLKHSSRSNPNSLRLWRTTRMLSFLQTRRSKKRM